MPNELPRQLYIARFTLKCGAVFDVVTPLTAAEIKKELAEHPATIPGVNTQKQWPVDAIIYDEVASFIHSPYEVWLNARPKLEIS